MVISLRDNDKNVRENACEILGRLGGKAATSEVINGLVVSLGDSDWNIRKSACEALGKVGEKAATSQVINGLVISLGDSDNNVRASACEVLRRLGEKAATSEVINRLISSLEDNAPNVRESACWVLGRLGEKAATSELINRLVISPRHRSKNVRWLVIEVLGGLGEKAATSEVIGRLAIALGDNRSWNRKEAVESLNELVNKLGRRNRSEVSSIPDNSEHLRNEDELVGISNICMKLFKLLLKSEDTFLIPGCLTAAVFGECYVIVIENRIVVSGDTQPLKIELSDRMKREILRGFDNLWGQVTNAYGVGGALPEEKLKQNKSYLTYCHTL